MTRAQLTNLLERLDGYGMVITDYEDLHARLDAEVEYFHVLNCHLGICTIHDDLTAQAEQGAT